MQISNNGIKILKSVEGCVKRAGLHVVYDDKTGMPVPTNMPLPHGATIGYGHLVRPGEKFPHGITEIAATELLRRDIAIAEQAVRNSIVVTLTQNQFDALVILAYNIGANNFSKSTVVKYINNQNCHDGRYPDLRSAWFAWNKSCGHIMPGLTKRRACEWRLFNEKT